MNKHFLLVIDKMNYHFSITYIFCLGGPYFYYFYFLC